MIISISGLIGSGKDTIADYLVNLHGFRRESFAGNLKDAICNIFGWDRTLLEGRTKQSREWREHVDEWWAERLEIPNLTPRWILQHVGTDVLRKHFHSDIWLASLENKLRKTTDDIVISDVRFKNEVAMLKRLGAICVQTNRGDLPTWYDTAMIANTNNDSIKRGLANKKLEELQIHKSEYDWIGTDFDMTFNNDGSLDDLYEQVENLISFHTNQQIIDPALNHPASI